MNREELQDLANAKHFTGFVVEGKEYVMFQQFHNDADVIKSLKNIVDSNSQKTFIKKFQRIEWLTEDHFNKLSAKEQKYFGNLFLYKSMYNICWTVMDYLEKKDFDSFKNNYDDIQTFFNNPRKHNIYQLNLPKGGYKDKQDEGPATRLPVIDGEMKIATYNLKEELEELQEFEKMRGSWLDVDRGVLIIQDQSGNTTEEMLDWYVNKKE